MDGKKELGFLKTNASSLKELLARITLRSVRSQGHAYVELREDGKRFVFFCTLCLAPCYSDTILADHLKGNLHNGRLHAAKLTLLRPNPWPFNDGVLFFHNSSEQDQHLIESNASQSKSLIHDKSETDDFPLVCYEENLMPETHSDVPRNISLLDTDCDAVSPYQSMDGADCSNISHDRDVNVVRTSDLVIPGLLLKEKISDLEVRLIGIGQIAARLYEKDDVSNGISRIWCEWLGKKNLADEDILAVPLHDFSIVTFAYYYILGRKGLFDDVKCLLPSSPRAEIEENEDDRKKRQKCFSDSEDVIESLSNTYDSSGEDSQFSNSSSSRMLLAGCDDPLLHSSFLLSRTLRRELRRKQRIAAERMCGICQQKMLPGKDVGTIFNMQTGRLVCSSRNVNGAFHVFHVSCLVHWLLLCEAETHTNQLVVPKVKQRSRRKSKAKQNEIIKNHEKRAIGEQLYSVFCPECQGTGIAIDGDDLQKPTIDLSEVFKHKIKVSNAHREWMKNPEQLQNCSTGLNFPVQSDETVQIQETVSPLKLLQFYRADE